MRMRYPQEIFWISKDLEGYPILILHFDSLTYQVCLKSNNANELAKKNISFRYGSSEDFLNLGQNPL